MQVDRDTTTAFDSSALAFALGAGTVLAVIVGALFAPWAMLIAAAFAVVSAARGLYVISQRGLAIGPVVVVTLNALLFAAILMAALQP